MLTVFRLIHLCIFLHFYVLIALDKSLCVMFASHLALCCIFVSRLHLITFSIM